MSVSLTARRYFRNFFICDECPNEWEFEMVTVSHDWCPCCDLQCEPYASVALFDDTEIDDEEEVA